MEIQLKQISVSSKTLAHIGIYKEDSKFIPTNKSQIRELMCLKTHTIEFYI